MAKQQTARDRFRTKTIGSNTTRTEETVAFPFPCKKHEHPPRADASDLEAFEKSKAECKDCTSEQILLISPSTKVYEDCQEMAGPENVFAPDGKTTIKRFKRELRLPLGLIVHCVFEPQSRQSMFAASDLAVLIEEDANHGWLARLCAEVMKFIQAKPEAAAKNSDATPAGESSSS